MVETIQNIKNALIQIEDEIRGSLQKKIWPEFCKFLKGDELNIELDCSLSDKSEIDKFFRVDVPYERVLYEIDLPREFIRQKSAGTLTNDIKDRITPDLKKIGSEAKIKTIKGVEFMKSLYSPEYSISHLYLSQGIDAYAVLLVVYFES